MSRNPVNVPATTETEKALGKKIGIASLIVMGSVLLSRVLGQVRESYIAYVGGVGGEVDAYNIAFLIPDILNHIIAGGYLSVTFIPIFATHLENQQESGGWRVFSIIVTVFTIFLGVLTVAAMWFAPGLVCLVAPGLADRPETLALAVRMTRIILPAQLCFFMGGILMAVQYAKGHFLIPALAPIVYNLGIILGGVVLGGSLGMEGFSWGVLAGSIVGQVILQVYGAKRVGMIYRPTFQIKHPDFGRFIWLTVPLIVGLGMQFSMEFFYKFFGSMLDEGTVASLNYALRTNLLLVALFGQAAGVASFPFLARLYAQGAMQKLLSVLDGTIRRYICLIIPAAALMAVVAREVVVILFQRGAFSAEDTEVTTLALRIYLAGAFAIAAGNIMVRGFYAMKNTWLPALLSIATAGLSIPLYWIFVKFFSGPGVALGVTVSGLLQMFVLYSVWNWRAKNRGWPTYFALIRAFGLSALASGIGWLAREALLMVFNETKLGGALMICVGVSLVFVGLTLALARLFGVEEILDVARKIFKIRTRAKEEFR